MIKHLNSFNVIYSRKNYIQSNSNRPVLTRQEQKQRINCMEASFNVSGNLFNKFARRMSFLYMSGDLTFFISFN